MLKKGIVISSYCLLFNRLGCGYTDTSMLYRKKLITELLSVSRRIVLNLRYHTK